MEGSPMSEAIPIFEYKTYQSYLSDRLGKLGSRNGNRQLFAKKVGVHPSYISLILKGSSHLSLEQAAAANMFFDHSKDEGDFFILLVARDRAGTELLKKHFQNQIDGLLKQRSQVEHHVKGKEVVLKAIQDEYYSSYLYPAVFVLASIPSVNSERALAQALNVSPLIIDRILKFLLSSGILERHGTWVRPGKRVLHLNKSELAIKKHHANWRIHALQSIDKNPEEGSHYSACFSISKKDAEILNAMILSDLEKYLKLIGSSKEEVGYVFNFDLYPLISNLD